ncbi:hypothetical protein BC940DRAFT_291598 [Gongronella butleri]|nr:hypothetical protein BC940DRAFT_291598 [Gongronella butleri]
MILLRRLRLSPLSKFAVAPVRGVAGRLNVSVLACRRVQPNCFGIDAIAPPRRFFVSSTTSSSSHSSHSSRFCTLAFYKLHPLDPASLPGLRTTLLDDFGRLGMVGRIYISKEGINAQVSCPAHAVESLREYCQTKIAPLVGGSLMDLNIATEGDHPAFRALHVRIRKQLVADGLDPDSYDLACRPSHLSPEDWHHKLADYKAQHGKDPVLIDMRNHYESNIGYFEGAVRPDADTFRDSIEAMNEICKDLPKDQEIFMYCTGGIRCSKAGAILQSQQGFEHVHLVEGGITAYGRWIQEQKDLDSLFRGKNFTFDARMGETITDEITGTQCMICGDACNRYQNCAHAQCNLLMICCSKCASRFLNTCARLDCYDTIAHFCQEQKQQPDSSDSCTTATSTSNSTKPSITGHHQPRPYYDAAGPLSVNGVRAYVKLGHAIDDHAKHDRVVIGTAGKACEHEYHRRTRAIEVLGQPGDVLKMWAEAGRALPAENSSK